MPLDHPRDPGALLLSHKLPKAEADATVGVEIGGCAVGPQPEDGVKEAGHGSRVGETKKSDKLEGGDAPCRRRPPSTPWLIRNDAPVAPRPPGRFLFLGDP